MTTEPDEIAEEVPPKAPTNRLRFWLETATVALLSALIPGFILFSWPKHQDGDSFYHFGHSMLMVERGPLEQSFPWTAYSAIGAFNADLWYGLHALAAPFALFAPGLLGLKLSTVFVAAVGCLLLWYALRRLEIAPAWLAPALVLGASYSELARLLTLRPQTISLGLFVLLLSLLCRGPVWACLVTGWAIAFAHQTLSWMTPAIVLVGVAAVLVAERRFAWKGAMAALAGMALGWIVRPGAADAVQLMKIQIVELMRMRDTELPIEFGTELYPMSSSALFDIFPFFSLLWGAALVLLVGMAIKKRLQAKPEQRAFAFASAALSVVFYQVTTGSSGRAMDYWVAFGAVTIAATFFLVASSLAESESVPNPIQFVSGVAAAGMIVMATVGFANPAKVTPLKPDRLKPAMDWLAANTPKDSIVVTPHWDMFAEMFYWNRHNRYVQGMDPIFLLTQNPGLYWKLHYLASGEGVQRTSGTPPNEELKPEDTFHVLKNDFRAAATLLVKPLTPDLNNYMATDPRYTKGYEDESIAVYVLGP